MKKIFCGAVIALIGVIYSIALMVLATVNDVYLSLIHISEPTRLL